MLGIIGAMDEEVAKIKEHMTDVEVHSKASMDFYKERKLLLYVPVSVKSMPVSVHRSLSMITKSMLSSTPESPAL